MEQSETMTQTEYIKNYPYTTDVSDISNLIREYIDTPVSEIVYKHFENDYWGLANILRAADRRIGNVDWTVCVAESKIKQLKKY